MAAGIECFLPFAKHKLALAEELPRVGIQVKALARLLATQLAAPEGVTLHDGVTHAVLAESHWLGPHSAVCVVPNRRKSAQKGLSTRSRAAAMAAPAGAAALATVVFDAVVEPTTKRALTAARLFVGSSADATQTGFHAVENVTSPRRAELIALRFAIGMALAHAGDARRLCVCSCSSIATHAINRYLKTQSAAAAAGNQDILTDVAKLLVLHDAHAELLAHTEPRLRSLRRAMMRHFKSPAFALLKE